LASSTRTQHRDDTHALAQITAHRRTEKRSANIPPGGGPRQRLVDQPQSLAILGATMARVASLCATTRPMPCCLQCACLSYH
jgi:hypothetical protein